MKFCPQCKIEKSSDNFWNSKKSKDGMACYCKDCYRLRQKEYTATHKEHVRSKALSFYYENKERISKERKEKYNPKPKKPSPTLETIKMWKERWKKNNKDKICAYANKRRAILLKSVPDGVDWEAINNVYKEAAERRKNGEDVQVDHIIPLMGKTVRGMHCAENLRIISRRENLSKGNRIPQDINLSDYLQVIYN